MFPNAMQVTSHAQGMFSKANVFFLICIVIAGCDAGGDRLRQHDEFISARIYYREMNSFSPIRFSENMLRESPMIRASINNSSDLQALRDNLPTSCNQVVERPIPDLDLYLVIYLKMESGQKQKFSSSRLDYYYGYGPTAIICEFSIEERDRLAEWIESRVNK